MLPPNPPANIVSEPLLEVRDLQVSFTVAGEEVVILEHISFRLEPRQTLGIVGESGSGKSVTAMSIPRIISTPPLRSMSGEINFNGRNLLSLDQGQLRKIRGREIGFIFQEPMTALNPVLSIGDQIVETILAHEAVGRKEAWNRGVDLLAEVQIPGPAQRMKSYPHELSGGMRQRAMIAMALACSPKLLIADEPTTALDVTVQAQVLELFKELQKNREMAIIFITHDLGVIAEIADRVLVMRHGAIVEENEIGAIFDRPLHPYTRQLLSLM